jgi:hypothetical protein
MGNETTEGLTPAEVAQRIFGKPLSLERIDGYLRVLPGLERREREVLRAYARHEHVRANTAHYRQAFATEREAINRPAINDYHNHLIKTFTSPFSLTMWLNRLRGIPAEQIDRHISDSVRQYAHTCRADALKQFLARDPGSPHFTDKGYAERAAALTHPLASAVFNQLSHTDWKNVPLQGAPRLAP